MTSLSALLNMALDRRASDLHLSAGQPPVLRIDGQLHSTIAPTLTHEDIIELLSGLLSQTQLQTFRQALELDFSHECPGLCRIRVHAFHHDGGAAAAVRLIPQQVSSLQTLGAPPILEELALQTSGLVLITGATGCGKSTTLAAMVEHRQQQQACHIITIEDPIEFRYRSGRGLIHQREVGTHTHSFADALRAALREDPDVIVVGELRDLPSIQLALTAAETGHLVLATLHAARADQAIDRIVDVFSTEDKALVRTMLAQSLLAVVSQTLVARRDGQGRVAAMEVMTATPATRHLIRENKIAQLRSVMQSGGAQGMQTLDQHLAVLMNQGVIMAL